MAAIFLASCGSARLPMPEIKPYRMEIQQGNFVSQESVSQLKVGMSKDQVRFILGTPLITDSFHGDRWDYLFRRQKVNSTELEQRNFTVFFQDGKLARIEGDVMPSSAPQGGAAAIKPSEPQRATPPPSKPPAPPASLPSQPAPEPKPAVPTSSEAPKPPQAAVPPQPTTAPPSGADEAPKEKSWWERLKDKVKF